MSPLSSCLRALVASLAASYVADGFLVHRGAGAGEAGAARQQKPTSKPALEVSKNIPGFCECFSVSKAPKLTVFSATVGLNKEYVTALRQNRAIVSEAYDYEYCEFNVDLSHNRPPVWTKVSAIQALLQRGRQRIAWMDADAFFTHKLPFEGVKTKQGEPIFELGKDVILTDDHPLGDPCGMNLGVLAMNNSEWSRSFWQTIWNMKGPDTDKLGLEEQSAVCLYRQGHKHDFGDHVKVLAHKFMNNIGRTDATFIAHMAGGGFLGGHEEKYEKLLPQVEAANRRMLNSSAREKNIFTKNTRTDQFPVWF